MSVFGKRLKELRTQRHLSQKELGSRFKLSESAIGMYERGERQPTIELLQQLADFFEVSVDSLVGRESEQENTGSADSERGVPDVEQIAAHMESEYGVNNPAFAEFLTKVIKKAIKEYEDEQKKKPE